jgi:hypothetical protein
VVECHRAGRDSWFGGGGGVGGLLGGGQRRGPSRIETSTFGVLREIVEKVQLVTRSKAVKE